MADCVIMYNMRIVSESELAYFAGVLDGEGTFAVYNSGGHYHSVVCFGSTSEELITWALSRFGGFSYDSPQTGNREDSKQWKLQSRTAISCLLPSIIPFLVVKHLHAQLLLKFCSQFENCSGGRRLTQEETELRNAYCTLFSSLNAVGTGSSDKKLEVVRLFASGGVLLP